MTDVALDTGNPQGVGFEIMRIIEELTHTLQLSEITHLSPGGMALCK